MEGSFKSLHCKGLFGGFIFQDCFDWDINKESDLERMKQWMEIFNVAFEDISSKRVGKEGARYIKCREYICKNWCLNS